jgi:hypothetical protein
MEIFKMLYNVSTYLFLQVPGVNKVQLIFIQVSRHQLLPSFDMVEVKNKKI